MNANQTPAPWTAGEFGQITGPGVSGSIAQTYLQDIANSIKIREANAKLIAAAPDLLEFAQQALALLDKQREEYNAAFTVMPRPKADEGPIAAGLRAAIAKATKD